MLRSRISPVGAVQVAPSNGVWEVRLGAAVVAWAGSRSSALEEAGTLADRLFNVEVKVLDDAVAAESSTAPVREAVGG